MNIIKSKINGIKTIYSNPDPFNKGIVELSEDIENGVYNMIGYLHSENPLDPNEIYIKFQNNPTNKIYPDQMGGIKLKELIRFLEDLYKEETAARKNN